MKDYTKETDARIIIDDQLRQANWDPADKSQVLTEVAAYGRSSKETPYYIKEGETKTLTIQIDYPVFTMT